MEIEKCNHEKDKCADCGKDLCRFCEKYITRYEGTYDREGKLLGKAHLNCHEDN